MCLADGRQPGTMQPGTMRPRTMRPGTMRPHLWTLEQLFAAVEGGLVQWKEAYVWPGATLPLAELIEWQKPGISTLAEAALTKRTQGKLSQPGTHYVPAWEEQ